MSLPENPYESPKSESAIPPRHDTSDLDLQTTDWILAVLCSGIGCIMGIIWMIQGKPKGTKMLGISFLCTVIWNVIRFAIVASQQ